jgi:hypothetical protein
MLHVSVVSVLFSLLEAMTTPFWYLATTTAQQNSKHVKSEGSNKL